jgi:hypothetical protein
MLLARSAPELVKWASYYSTSGSSSCTGDTTDCCTSIALQWYSSSSSRIGFAAKRLYSWRCYAVLLAVAVALAVAGQLCALVCDREGSLYASCTVLVCAAVRRRCSASTLIILAVAAAEHLLAVADLVGIAQNTCIYTS